MLFSLNFVIDIFSIISEFVTTVLIPFLNNHIFEGITITVIISLASGSRAARILDVTSKVVGSAAGSTINFGLVELLIKYWEVFKEQQLQQ